MGALSHHRRRVPQDKPRIPGRRAAQCRGVVVQAGVLLRVPRLPVSGVQARGFRRYVLRGGRGLGLVVIGVDIGQKYDPTAIAVVEHEWRKRDGREEDHWLVRHLERLPLGTAYPQVANRLTEVASGVRKRAQSTPTVYVDATGVGQPVVDELGSRGLSPIAVYFTHGDKRTEEGYGAVRLGKAWLVSRLQTLLQGR